MPRSTIVPSGSLEGRSGSLTVRTGKNASKFRTENCSLGRQSSPDALEVEQDKAPAYFEGKSAVWKGEVSPKRQGMDGQSWTTFLRGMGLEAENFSSLPFEAKHAPIPSKQRFQCKQYQILVPDMNLDDPGHRCPFTLNGHRCKVNESPFKKHRHP